MWNHLLLSMNRKLVSTKVEKIESLIYFFIYLQLWYTYYHLIIYWYLIISFVYIQGSPWIQCKIQLHCAVLIMNIQLTLPISLIMIYIWCPLPCKLYNKYYTNKHRIYSERACHYMWLKFDVQQVAHVLQKYLYSYKFY